MRETFTEFEVLQEALKKVNMAEDTMPFIRGKLCESESYNKMQQILAAPEMIKSHTFLLNLDPEQLDEDEVERIDKLWNLGVERGFITPEEDSATEAKPEDVSSAKAAPLSTVFSSAKVKVPCWTVLYSACDKNGDVKTGECYSNAINTRAAKADCYAKLERCGYSNIAILAIEAGDPDACGCEDVEVKADVEVVDAPKAEVEDKSAECKDCEISEDDMLKNRPHNGHLSEEDVGEADHSFDEVKPEDAKAKELSAKFAKFYPEFLTAADDYQETLKFSDEDSIAAKDAFKDVQAAYAKCYAAAAGEDEAELLQQVREYGFKLTPDNCRILESDDSIEESGNNPYAAGMKTSELGGVSKVQKVESKKEQKTELVEDDEDAASEDEDADDSSDEETNAEDSEDSTEENSKDDDASKDDNSSEEETEKSENDDSSSEEETSADENSNADDAEDKEKESSSSEDDMTSGEEDNEKSEEDADDSDEKEESNDKDEDDENDKDDSSDDDDEVEKDVKEELSAEEKTQYKNEYKKTFKDIMLKCKFEDKSFDDLTIAEKVEFFKALNKAWTKNEPVDFMSSKEIEQLNKVTVKK